MIMLKKKRSTSTCCNGRQSYMDNVKKEYQNLWMKEKVHKRGNTFEACMLTNCFLFKINAICLFYTLNNYDRNYHHKQAAWRPFPRVRIQMWEIRKMGRHKV